MKSLNSFAAVLLVAWRALATVTVPLTKVVNTNPYYSVSAAERTRARVTYLGYGDKSGSIPIINQVDGYAMNVGIGEPPTNYFLQIDTGSSNTFCGIGKNYARTVTSIDTGEKLNITYGSGSAGIIGEEYLDQVTIGRDLIITNQSIGGITASNGFSGMDIDGIVGFGPEDLTLGTLSPNRAMVPTVMDSLVAQGLIEKNVFGMYLVPSTTDVNITNGALTLGGVDESLFEGNLTYVPMTETYPTLLYWGINVTLITYGNQVISCESSAGIVDSGSPLILFAEKVFNAYVEAIPGASFDNQTGLLEIPPDSISSMKPLEFMIGGRAFELDVKAQLIPQDQNVIYGGEPNKRYGVVANVPTPAEWLFQFILGMNFIQRYYTVFDADENRIGFANTKHTFS